MEWSGPCARVWRERKVKGGRRDWLGWGWLDGIRWWGREGRLNWVRWDERCLVMVIVVAVVGVVIVK